ncbi:MAG: AMP-binding protein [Jatrophihabitantaceae bacterium]
MWETLVRPSAERAEAFRASGRWRDQTVLDDLRRAAQDTPDKPAIIGYVDGKLARTVSYREFGSLVDRFAAALLELGVRRADVVAIHLPNWWMLTPLYLACSRIGAVPAPVMPPLGARELQHVLTNSAAKVCFVPDSYNGVDYLQRLFDVAPDTLAHRVVVRTRPAEQVAGVLDFAEFFLDSPWEQTHELPELVSLDADDVALLLFTSGTSGAPKAVVHSHNTMYACATALPECWGWGSDIVASVPHALTHMAGSIFGCYLPVILGGTSVMQDDKDLCLLLDMIEAQRLTYVYAAPVWVQAMVDEQRKNPRDLSSLRQLISGSMPIPPQLVAETQEVLGVELGTLWGMTENGPVTVTKPDDPPDWGAHSDGSPVGGSEIRLAAEPGEEIGRLLVRGPTQCLGYLNQKELYQACLDPDGWFDTGDLARPDGRGGIRITGRREDLIVRRFGTKVPTLEVEAVIARHPRVREVALIGYPDKQFPSTDGVCAMIVPDGEPPSLDELTSYLDGLGMTWHNWPDRVEIRQSLPRTSMGKVQRAVLRQELEQPAGIGEG